MLRSLNVATPFTAVTVLVPDNVPGMTKPLLVPIAIVTGPLKLGTGWPAPSVAVTSTAGCIDIIGIVVLG